MAACLWWCFTNRSSFLRHYERTLENLAAGDIILSEEDLDSIKQVLDSIPVKGDRYAKDTDDLMG